MLPILHRMPDFLLAILACWLGLSLFIRAPKDRGTRAFAWFGINIGMYGLTALLLQMTSDPEVAHFLGRLRLIATVVTPAVFLQFIAVLVTRRTSVKQREVIAVCYTTGVSLALYAAFGPLPEPVPPFPIWARWGEMSFPPGWLYGAWTAQRIVPLLIALWLMGNAYRQPPNDEQERRLRVILGFSAVVGVGGAIAATIARTFNLSPALPLIAMLFGMLLTTSAVFTNRSLLPARIAQRAFIYSLFGSLLTAGYIGLVLTLEWFSSKWLKLDSRFPLVSIFSLVALVSALGPLRDWLRNQFDRRFLQRELDYSSLLRELSDDLLERGDLSEQLQTALSTICRALGIRAGLVIVSKPEGLAALASYGTEQAPLQIEGVTIPETLQDLTELWEPWPPAKLLLPLRRGTETLGLLALGLQRSEQTLNATEQALLDYVSNYLAFAISSYNLFQEKQQEVLATMIEGSRALREQQEQIARRAEEAEEMPPPEEPSKATGLRVYALGSLRVEFGGEQVTRWGGDKAGTNQAEALFAYLFDRRGKGITKDEIEEVIWPDLDIGKADSNFHRTLAALRRTLEPNLTRGNLSKMILYQRERYWLEPRIIAWTDTDAFLTFTEAGIASFRQGDYAQALKLIAQAKQLYRGDYMDDCPFFGDSSAAEDQRLALRSRYVDAQLVLGAIYEAQGQVREAAAAYRHALTLSPEGCPPAQEGLTRLQAKLSSG